MCERSCLTWGGDLWLWTASARCYWISKHTVGLKLSASHRSLLIQIFNQFWWWLWVRVGRGGQERSRKHSGEFLHWSNRNLKHILVAGQFSTLPLSLSEQTLISDQYWQVQVGTWGADGNLIGELIYHPTPRTSRQPKNWLSSRPMEASIFSIRDSAEFIFYSRQLLRSPVTQWEEQQHVLTFGLRGLQTVQKVKTKSLCLFKNLRFDLCDWPHLKLQETGARQPITEKDRSKLKASERKIKADSCTAQLDLSALRWWIFLWGGLKHRDTDSDEKQKNLIMLATKVHLQRATFDFGNLGVDVNVSILFSKTCFIL